MHLIAVTDIFGRTSCFEEMANLVSTGYESVEMVDPYGNADLGFMDEKEAYAHFSETIGLNGYIAKLYQHLKKKRPPCDFRLIGFSVGASAVWAVSEMLKFNKRTKGICFYGSQIRHLLHVRPQIEIDLYFPTMEPHFDVDELMDVLGRKAGVTCHKTDYLHGFMNKRSKNFDEEGFSKYIDILKKSRGCHGNP